MAGEGGIWTVDDDERRKARDPPGEREIDGGIGITEPESRHGTKNEDVSVGCWRYRLVRAKTYQPQYLFSNNRNDEGFEFDYFWRRWARA